MFRMRYGPKSQSSIVQELDGAVCPKCRPRIHSTLYQVYLYRATLNSQRYYTLHVWYFSHFVIWSLTSAIPKYMSAVTSRCVGLDIEFWTCIHNSSSDVPTFYAFSDHMSHLMLWEQNKHLSTGFILDFQEKVFT